MNKFIINSASMLLIFVLITQANALKCWNSSSVEYPEEQKQWDYIDCGVALSQEGYSEYYPTWRHVCKKLEQIINDKVVISRSCTWEDINSSPDDCLRQYTPSYIKNEFCETCSTDGCNGAGQWGPVALLTALPVVIVKFLLW